MATELITTAPTGSTATAARLSFARHFSSAEIHPYDEVEWERRSAVIKNERGEAVFEQHDVEIPASWSQTATNVVVSKYFRGALASPEREHSVRQLIDRVVDTIARWGLQDGYLEGPEQETIFADELRALVLHQRMAFNSPVWFNVGLPKNHQPQTSACFINSVGDSLSAILDLAKTEGMLFKHGSGAGSNLSTIRSSREGIAGGGQASGPVSFMRGLDAFAGSIRSGGKTRRAAKMVLLDVDHPDIEEFIWCKADEEKKAWALIDAGYDGGFNVPGGAYDSVAFQNANHSIRVTDAFMRCVESEDDWNTSAVVTGQTMDTMPAGDLLRQAAEASWICGDPGLQFDTTINAWHTCPNTDRIHASNPCSEYLFLNDSACNLASLNLMRYRDEHGTLQLDDLRAAVQLTITAQEILVSRSSYPSAAIERNSHAFRPLGLGYANLGALLMASGLPYDSDEGRALAASLTALICGEAYAQSARLAHIKGPFLGYSVNDKPMRQVLRKHRAAVEEINAQHLDELGQPILQAARKAWDEALSIGDEHGYRNAQATVLAPTGTIGFLMDCDTTGVEPDIALVKYKKLVGGGYFKIVNHTVAEALHRLGYPDEHRRAILEHLAEHDTIEGAPHLRDEHLPVFDCAFEPANGSRSIQPMGHVKMLAAVQPYISGSISKTVNVPHEATIDDIYDIYLQSWKLGLKCVAVYRDGCKRTQPLSTKMDDGNNQRVEKSAPRRRRLPDERPSITHKFSINGYEGYITVGMYEDGAPGELFITMSKEGSVLNGLMDAFATSISMCMQYGVPLEVLVTKFSHMRFEPSGWTNNPRIRIAKSIVDYIFRWLGDKFLEADPDELAARSHAISDILDPETRKVEQEGGDGQQAQKGRATQLPSSPSPGLPTGEKATFQLQSDAPPCHTCGSIMVRNGACYKCANCGATSGCS